MTKLLEMAIEAARQLPPEEQDELARAIMGIVHVVGGEPYVLSEKQRAAIDEGIAEADRGDFASEEDVRALFSNYRL